MKLFMLTFALLSLNSAFAADAPLDGKSFHGKMDHHGMKMESDLSFKEGTFISTSCANHGFKPGAYKTETKGKKTTFSATLLNDKGETMEWSGTIDGAKVSAKGKHVHADGKAGEFTYSGKSL